MPQLTLPDGRIIEIELHGQLRPGALSGIHVVHDYEVANAAGRLALIVDVQHIGKVCRQLDGTGSFWILAGFTGGGPDWRRIDGGGAGDGLPTPVPTWTGVPSYSPGPYWTEQPTLPRAITAADLGRAFLTVDGELFVLAAYQAAFLVPANGLPEHTENNNVWQRVVYETDLASLATNASITSILATLDTKADRAFVINARASLTYTLDVLDAGRLVTMNNAAAQTVTIPTDATAMHPVGTPITVAQLGTGAVTVVAAAGGVVTLLGSGVIGVQHGFVTLIKLAANTWIVAGGGGSSVAISTAAPTNVDAAASSGGTVAAGAAARDHKHSIVTSAPVAVGTANAAGSGSALALASHVHDASHLAPKNIAITTFATARTLALADNNTILMCTAGASAEVIVTIPTDATLNLPLGFTVTLLNRSALEAWLMPQIDFYPNPWGGTPDLFYLGEGVPTTPPSTRLPYCQPGGALTAIKVGANLWWISGNITAEF